MNILHVASEVAPYSKTGGLADVTSALPRAIAALSDKRRATGGTADRVAIVLPRYRADPGRFGLARRLTPLQIAVGATRFDVTLYEGRLPGGGGAVTAWLLDHPVYDRPDLYHHAGRDYADNALRFGLLSRAALAVARAQGFAPDVVHAHDWQAAPSLLYLRRGAEPELANARAVLTIHNVAFQGNFPPAQVADLGFGHDLLHPDGIEFYGAASFLKAGIRFADRVTTVSPRYAHEIQTEAGGCGLDGFLRSQLGARGGAIGILNGADYGLWDPRRDPRIARRYGPGDLDGKRDCKAALQRELGLPPRPRTPLACVVSRLTHQKGIDLAVEALEGLLPESEVQVAVLGAGEPELAERITALSRRFPARLQARFGLDEDLAHRLYAGSDLLLMPSRHEPCGLTQLYALRHGAAPIVRATGGLDDTVVDHDARSRSGTGFKFAEASAPALARAIKRAIAVYAREDEFTALVERAMAQDFPWARAATRYRALYASIAAPPTA